MIHVDGSDSINAYTGSVEEKKIEEIIQESIKILDDVLEPFGVSIKRHTRTIEFDKGFFSMDVYFFFDSEIDEDEAEEIDDRLSETFKDHEVWGNF